MRKCPKLLAASTWLGTRAGHRVTYGLVGATPAPVIFVKLAIGVETTFALIAGGICIITAFGMTAFWVCGRSLMRAIDESLGQQQASCGAGSSSNETKTANGGERGGSRRSRRYSTTGDLSLMAARRKVKLILTCVISSGASTEIAMIFGIGSGYGASAPLVLLLTPLAVSAPFWYSFNVQVHAGRSNGGRRSSFRRVTLPAIGPPHGRRPRRPPSLVGSALRYSYRNQVLPTEVVLTAPC